MIYSDYVQSCSNVNKLTEHLSAESTYFCRVRIAVVKQGVAEVI